MQPQNKECGTGVGLRKGLWALTLAGTVALGGCDFEVTNPGPVQDRFLDDPAAFEAMVNGMTRVYSGALATDAGGGLVKWAGTVTREIFPSGNQVSFGVGPHAERGILRPEIVEAPWEGGQNARWIAEAGIERMEHVLGSEAESHGQVARAYMWAGFSNKLLGENMCEAVINGGERQPRTVFLERADAHFTRAIEIGSAAGDDTAATAARAARASVRMDLGLWDEAVADAVQIPKDFAFQTPYFNISETEYNMWVWSKMGSPWRSFSVWNTPYEAYAETGDPRVSWDREPGREYGGLSRPCCGPVPFMRQTKYNALDDGIDIADGREMILIRAEALLMDQQWQTAIDLINTELRAPLGVTDLTVNSLEDAWTAFRFERGIELWLEGRRLNDFRRWETNGVPGSYQPLEDANNPETFLDPDRSLCFPIPRSEEVTNPNLGG